MARLKVILLMSDSEDDELEGYVTASDGESSDEYPDDEVDALIRAFHEADIQGTKCYVRRH